jgi:hypothetical protein
MKRVAMAVAFAAVVSACAKSPESIAPAYVSELTYQHLTCDQMGQEMLRLTQALATASTAQEQARSGDIAGVILLGLPVSTLSGANIAPEIARLKGEQEAIQRAALTRNCTLPTIPEPPASAQTLNPREQG